MRVFWGRAIYGKTRHAIDEFRAKPINASRSGSGWRGFAMCGTEAYTKIEGDPVPDTLPKCKRCVLIVETELKTLYKLGITV